LGLSLASRAEAKELKQMPPHFEASHPGKSLFQPLKVTIGKVDHRTTFRANQVMVVPNWLPHEIAPATAPGMHLTDETQLSEYRQGTIDSNQPDARVFLANPMTYRRRGKVVRAYRDYPQDCPPLRGEPVTVLP
jgi:hypothetical protein